MNSLPNEKAVEKIVYLVSQDFNERWGKRVINEFSSVKSELKKMFEARYND